MTWDKNIAKVTRVAFIVLLTVTMGLQPKEQVNALGNGLAKTPPMGWNSWNIFHGNINETQIKQIADTMVSSGMKDAGYIYLNLDDNWMANPARDSSGNLKCDPTRFPSGMKALGDYIHSKGLKFGIYGCRGSMTCMNVPKSGSYGNEERDAKTFASWGVDYLKYDNCNVVGKSMQTDYQNMQKALANCGRPIVFSICAWGYQNWMPATGNLWRTTPDITDKWDNGTAYFRGIINLIDENSKYASSAAPGAWNDPDMLEIGNGGCTTEEYRTQMSMWSMMAAPLIAGNDIRTMSQTTKDILLNKEVIAVDQDSAGIQGTRISASNGLEIWCKPLGAANGTTKAIALLNRNSSAKTITVNFANVGLSGTVTVRDLWAKADRGSFSGSYTMTVPSHGTGMLKLTGSTSQPSGNLLSNPGAENGNTGNWSINGAGTIAASTAQKHSGTYSLYHTGRTATWHGPLQNITSKVTNGKTYTCSGWVRLGNASSGTVTMTIKKTDGSGTTYATIATKTGSNSSWVQLSGTFSLSVTGTLSEVSIYFEGPNSGVALYVDDVSVQ